MKPTIKIILALLTISFCTTAQAQSRRTSIMKQSHVTNGIILDSISNSRVTSYRKSATKRPANRQQRPTYTSSVQAQTVKLFTNLYGSNNGQPFSLPRSREDILSLHRITKISIKHSSRRIEKVQVAWVNQDKSTRTQSTGENGGVWSHI